jgi:hypothetical protein
MVSMQVGVRRETPNPNVIHQQVGVRYAHPNLQGYFEMASRDSRLMSLSEMVEIPRLQAKQSDIPSPRASGEVRRGCRECPVDIHAAERVQVIFLHPGGNSQGEGCMKWR